MGIWDSFSDEYEPEKKRDEKQSCPKDGSTCPACYEGTLAYNGKLELVCSHCQAVFSAGFT